MFAWLRCMMRGHHSATRHFMGGFRCRDCGTVGADLAEMGFEDDGYVSPMRRTYSREHGAVTRTTSWDTGSYRIR